MKKGISMEMYLEGLYRYAMCQPVLLGVRNFRALQYVKMCGGFDSVR